MKFFQPILFLWLILSLSFNGSVFAASETDSSKLTGKLEVLYKDHYDAVLHKMVNQEIVYFLKLVDGKRVQLALTEEDKKKWRRFGGKQVIISLQNDTRTRSSLSNAITGLLVDDVSPVFINAENNVKKGVFKAGDQSKFKKPWVNLLCKFSDNSAEQSTPSIIQTIFSNSFPFLEHYWKKTTYNHIDISGTTTIDHWVTLPEARSYYIPVVQGDEKANLDKLEEDCKAAAADLYTDSLYFGTNLFFNGNLDGAAWGGGNVTWLPIWGHRTLGVIAHEMGHGYGLPHSSGRYGSEYDSPWDVMSNAYIGDNYGVYFNIPQHTIAFHKQLLGAIDDEHNYSNARFDTSLGKTFHLSRQEEKTENSRFLVANIYSADKSKRYSFEARDLIDYDSSLPAKAVIIHEIENDGRAYVVDPDEDGNPRDDSAQWVAGETFSDNENGITVKVLSETATGFNLEVTAPRVAPQKVKEITALSVLAEKIVINWKPVLGAEYYKVMRTEGFSFINPTEIVLDAGVSSYEDIPPDFKTYYYRIDACNDAGCSGINNFTYDSAKKTIVIEASDGIYIDKVEVVFLLFNQAEKYQLMRRVKESNATWDFVMTGVSSPLIDTTAQADKQYEYRVELYDSNNNYIVVSSTDIGFKANDSDGDGIFDAQDAFPFDASETLDTDGDGIGNNADTDDDNDGLLDTEEDANGNGLVDLGETNPLAKDTDQDGVNDNLDDFPLNANESVDTDNDGIGNNADNDDDGDGVSDSDDAFPLNASESVDTDNDGIGNNADNDDDGDGVSDSDDAFPLNANESVDTDNDGIGNNADTDDDGDGINDLDNLILVKENGVWVKKQSFEYQLNGANIKIEKNSATFLTYRYTKLDLETAFNIKSDSPLIEILPTSEDVIRTAEQYSAVVSVDGSFTLSVGGQAFTNYRFPIGTKLAMDRETISVEFELNQPLEF